MNYAILTMNITINGRTQDIKEWSKESGLSYQAILNRVLRGGTGDKILKKTTKPFSKNDLMWELDETPVANLPEPIKSLYMAHPVSTHVTKKPGDLIRRNYPEDFNAYYDKIKITR